MRPCLWIWSDGNPGEGRTGEHTAGIAPGTPVQRRRKKRQSQQTGSLMHLFVSQQTLQIRTPTTALPSRSPDFEGRAP